MERRRVLSLLLCIGIVGYFSVPSVANYVIHAHGGNGLLNKVTQIATSATNTTISTASGAGNTIGNRMEQGGTNLVNAPKNFMEGYRGAGGSGHQKDRLSGKPG